MLYSFLIAFLAVLSSIFFQKSKVLRKAGVVLFAFLTFIAIVIFAVSYYKGLARDVLSINFGLFSLNFKADSSGIAFALLISLLWGIAALYSFVYMQANYPEKSDVLFQFCYSLSVFLAILFAFAADLVTMFIIYELITIATMPLVGFKRNEESKIGLFKYIKVLLGCSLLFLLPATFIIVQKVGVVLFEGSGFLSLQNFSEGFLKILLLMFLFGVAKAAMFPFHTWLPFAMCAPTPVSGLLHAVVVVKVGAFFILRVLHDIFGFDLLKLILSDFNFVMYISGFTILFASIMAIFQSNLKKRLAFSTISQISYIVLSLSTFTKLGLFVAVFQIISHALSKILLFFGVGGFYTSSHSNQIVDFTGMAQKNRLTCLLFLFACLSICGLPMTVGFLAKGLLFYNLIESKFYFGIIILSISAFLSFFYLMPVCYAIFEKAPQRQVKHFQELGYEFKSVFLLLAFLNILIFTLGSLFFLYYVNEW